MTFDKPIMKLKILKYIFAHYIYIVADTHVKKSITLLYRLKVTIHEKLAVKIIYDTKHIKY